MNLLEQYLARAAGVEKVIYGETISLNVDLAFAHDGSALKVIKAFNEINSPLGLDPEKFTITFDHCLPAPTSKARVDHKTIKQFANNYGIRLYDHGEGILHQVIAEKMTPYEGQVIIGADGHMLTSAAFGAIAFSVSPEELAAALVSGKHKISVPETVEINFSGYLPHGISAKDMALKLLMEFGTKELKGKAVILSGEIFDILETDDKMTLCNMLGEMGIMTALLTSKKGENTEKVFTIDISDMKDLIACPPSPDNVKTVEEISGTAITQVYIGGCTNGRLKDIEITAEVLKEEKVHSEVTLLVGPASSTVANEMEAKGFSEIIRKAGGIIINPGCGACSGTHQGIAGPDDIILTTTVRNTPGRMGDEAAQIYLVSPKVAVLSAVEGKIIHSKSD